MAVITPAQLREFSAFEAVKERSDGLLTEDILEAEIHINARLEVPLDEHDPLPSQLRLAMLKVAQFFALINSDESRVKGIKSEKMSDYSYTLADGNELRLPDISVLLGDYARQEEKKMIVRMRPL